MARDNGNGEHKPARGPGAFLRLERFFEVLNQRFAWFIGLPIVSVIGSLLASHYQYVSTYDDKLKTIAKNQVTMAETAFTDVSMQFSKAITLQAQLYFNYRDAIKNHREGDAQAMETKNAREIYKQYDDLRTELRESVDLMARRVEITLDWPSNPNHNGAIQTDFGADPMTRIALGRYNFQCDKDDYMPNFAVGSADVPPTEEILKETPGAAALHIDWFSAKHQLLTLFYCFDANHAGLRVVREWAANSTLDQAQKDAFAAKAEQTLDRLDREAVRMNSFLTLGARRIDAIHAKFRPSKWYCQVPIVRQYVDHTSRKCTPIRTAQAG